MAGMLQGACIAFGGFCCMSGLSDELYDVHSGAAMSATCVTLAI